MTVFLNRHRTKIGVLSLVFAMLLMGACTRSYFTDDSIGFSTGKYKTVGLISARGSLIWCAQYHENVETSSKITKWTSKSDLFACDGFTYEFKFGAFEVATIGPYQRTEGVASRVWRIPYGILVVPMCLLSYTILETKSQEQINWCQVGKFALILYVIVVVFGYLSNPSFND